MEFKEMNIDMVLINYQDAVIFQLLNDLSKEGLTIKELMEVEFSNIDFERQELYVNNKVFKISRKTLDIVFGAFHQKYYYLENGNIDEVVKLVEGKTIIKGTEEEPLSLDLINKRIRIIRDKLDLPDSL